MVDIADVGRGAAAPGPASPWTAPDPATAARSASPPRADPTDSSERSTTRRTYRHAAFISYSHKDRHDAAFARALERGLEQMGKRWGRWRALDVFLDEHDLATDPELEQKLFSHYRSIGHELTSKKWETGLNPVYPSQGKE